MTVESLLQKLSDGNFHSGEELGRHLAVSRTAVWKQLQKLEELGLPLESVKGRGYRLPGGLRLLSRAAIEASLDAGARAAIREIDVRSVVESTNTLAAAAAHGYVCTAEQQTAGRGRRGRDWVSPFARNLYFSLVWEFQGGAAALEGLSLAVGVAVVRALQRFGIEGLRLKWPNDVLLDGRKLAGILLEMQGDAMGVCQVVIGIGLNVAMPREQGKAIAQPWADLSTVLGEAPDRNRLLGELLNTLIPVLDTFTARGFEALRNEWLALDGFRGQDVAVHVGDVAVTGVARGVNDSGGLLVETGAGLRTFHGGEVSLRKAP